MRTLAKVVPGRRPGQKEVALMADPSELPECLGALRLPLGASRYEARHGVGTATGLYPCAPDRSSPCEVGDDVEVIGIARAIDVPTAPSWAKKLFFLRVRVVRTAEEKAAEKAAEDAARELDTAHLEGLYARVQKWGPWVKDAQEIVEVGGELEQVPDYLWPRELRKEQIIKDCREVPAEIFIKSGSYTSPAGVPMVLNALTGRLPSHRKLRGRVLSNLPSGWVV